jgi:hypothetical protein
MSSSRRAQPPSVEGAERVLGIRKLGGGQQYEIQWRGQQETTWEAAGRVRKEIPQLVQEFEQRQQQLQQQPQPQQQQAPSAEGATDTDEARVEAVVVARADPTAAAAQQGGMSLQQVQALEQLVRDQAQQLRRQQEQHVAALQQLHASPAHFPQSSAYASPQRSPQQELRSIDAAAAAAAQPSLQSRFARKEPRAQDLQEYDGASGAKLDDWLKQLAMTARLYHLSAQESVDFAGSRLRGAALDWWLALGDTELAAIGNSITLAAALRARFQPVTAARTAREQLDKLQQGSRGINDYIADFQRLSTQIGLASLGEENALYAFERGLRRDLAVELRKQGVATLREAIALAARVGGLLQQVAAPQSRGTAAVNLMDIDDDGSASLDHRIQQAVLNAMQARDNGGMAAKTQTHRGYTQERGRGGGRGGSQSGRGGRFGGRPPMGTPTIPGVPAAVVEQRRAAGQCYRCGSGEHQGRQCPNATSASQQGN